MKPVYKLVGDKVVEFDGEKEVHSYENCNDLFNDDLELGEELAHELESGAQDFAYMMDSKKLVKEASAFVCKHFEEILKKKGSISELEYKKEASKLSDKFNDFGVKLYNEAKSNLENNLKNFLGNKTVNGGNMFKTIKEAKTFTAHLDALANEIESLEGVSSEMKKHLAYRLDRLSDLIETSSFQAEKTANGIGSGAWAQDKDEKYMDTFGGTGALMGDSDESKYMKEFKGDDHKEVLERKEPGEIAGAGAKKKQPSDSYNEGEVAKKLRETIKSIMAELK
jgi:hypothetical protein